MNYHHLFIGAQAQFLPHKGQAFVTLLSPFLTFLCKLNPNLNSLSCLLYDATEPV